MARGELLCVAEATPEHLPLIEKQDPQLIDAFRHITLEEPGPEKGKAILAAFARTRKSPGTAGPGLAGQRTLHPTGRDAIDRLHRRYATYSACPGRPLRFLENLLRDGP